VVVEKDKRGAHRGTHKENISPKPLVWKTRGAGFYVFLPSEGLRAWSFKGQQACLA